MRWWCAGEFNQRPTDSVEKPSTQDVALVVGATGHALLLILLLGDGSGVLWKLYGISHRPLSPWSAAVPLSSPSAPVTLSLLPAPVSLWPVPVPLPPWSAAVPPGVFHGNFDLTSAEDVSRALTGITHFYDTRESCRTDAPVREANSSMLPNVLSVFASNCSERLHVCLQITGKATVGATLLGNALPPCGHFGLPDAEDIAEPLTGILYFHVAWESRGTGAPARDANSAMLPNALSDLVSNYTKRIYVCLQATGRCTVGAALQRCSHFDLIHPESIAILKPVSDMAHVFGSVLCNALSVPVPRCPKQVRLHIGPSSKNLGVPLAVDSTHTTRVAILDIHPLNLRGQVSYREPASEKICPPSVGHWNTAKNVSYCEPASEKICPPSVGHWNTVKNVLPSFFILKCTKHFLPKN